MKLNRESSQVIRHLSEMSQLFNLAETLLILVDLIRIIREAKKTRSFGLGFHRKSIDQILQLACPLVVTEPEPC